MVALLLPYYCLHLSLSPSMATSTSTTGNLTPCPFCNVPYKGLGNHLKHCGQRDGRDYNQYLAPKTLKKSQPRKKTKCPKCSKSFWRLDTHLRRSGVCRSILPSPSRTVNVKSGAVSVPVNDSATQLAEAAILLASQDLNSAVVPPGVTKHHSAATISRGQVSPTYASNHRGLGRTIHLDSSTSSWCQLR